jgi:hypothetical protein
MSVEAAIEFHDSTLERAERVGDDVELILVAYVHRAPAPGLHRGTGWSQEARVRIRDSRGEASAMTIVRGKLSVAEHRYENLVPVPVRAEGPVLLELEGDQGEIVRLTGTAVSIDLTGEATFVEDLSWDWDE